MSAAGRSSGGFQVLDVGVNVRLQLADFVYRSLGHDGEVPRILWKDLRPQAIDCTTERLNLFDGLSQLRFIGYRSHIFSIPFLRSGSKRTC